MQKRSFGVLWTPYWPWSQLRSMRFTSCLIETWCENSLCNICVSPRCSEEFGTFDWLRVVWTSLRYDCMTVSRQSDKRPVWKFWDFAERQHGRPNTLLKFSIDMCFFAISPCFCGYQASISRPDAPVEEIPVATSTTSEPISTAQQFSDWKHTSTWGEPPSARDSKVPWFESPVTCGHVGV